MSEETNRKKLGTYAVVMILAAVFIIIIAAMADNREDQFEDQISEQSEINAGIQNQIVRLEDENYKLKKETEVLNGKYTELEKNSNFYQTISEVYVLALDGKPEEASAKLLELEEAALTEEQTAVYQTVQKQLQLP